MHKIRLNNAVFFAHHGVTAAEQQTGGRYEVDVEIIFNFEAAAREDDLDQTLCYETVYQVVKTVIKDSIFNLIERIAYLIAHQIIEMSKQIESVEVHVRKCNPPVQGTVNSSEVHYRLERT